MDFEEVASPRNTVVLLFIVSGLSLYLLFTAIPSASVSSDIAGLGTYRGTSTVSGQCEYVTATSRSFSTAPVSNALWGSSQFYVETDQLRYTFYSGQIVGSAPTASCSGTTVASYVVSSPAFPVTPAMVVLACGTGTKSCSFYPSNIQKTYSGVYAGIMAGLGTNIPLYQFSGQSVLPNNILVWEAVVT
jgi:hypothetical protein